MLSNTIPNGRTFIVILNFIIFFIFYLEGCEAHGCEAHLQRWKKKRISLFIHATEDRERLCERPGVIKMNDDINKMMFNINSHCFHPSNKAKTVILGSLPEITNADITSL